MARARGTTRPSSITTSSTLRAKATTAFVTPESLTSNGTTRATGTLRRTGATRGDRARPCFFLHRICFWQLLLEPLIRQCHADIPRPQAVGHCATFARVSLRLAISGPFALLARRVLTWLDIPVSLPNRLLFELFFRQCHA